MGDVSRIERRAIALEGVFDASETLRERLEPTVSGGGENGRT
jgi:hypothetical protein